MKDQVLLLREEVEAAESKSANVDRFPSIVDRYTEIPELTPHILHEFVEKIASHAATDPHSKVNRRQEVDIYYKGIGILEMSKVYDTRQNERNGIAVSHTVSLLPHDVFLLGAHITVPLLS